MLFYNNLKIKVGEIYEFVQKNEQVAATVLTTLYKVVMHLQWLNVCFLR